MNKKRKIIPIIIVLIIALIGIFYFFIREDRKTSLTVVEKRWIENNKNNVIDFSILNGVPIINNNGNGILFDFFDSLEKDTGLEFNRLSYEKDAKDTSDYALKVSDDTKNNILFYTDNYVIVTKDQVHYNDVTELKNLNLGVLESDSSKVKDYLGGSVNSNYKIYKTSEELKNAIKNGEVSGIVVPKLDYLEFVLNNNLNIAYNITEYKKNYVITLGKDEKLNKILTKYFKRYKETKFQKSLNKYIANSYFTFKNINEKKQTSFRSKRYSYGFIINEPFDLSVNNSLDGFNHSFIKGFADMANVEIYYKRYSTIKNVTDEFNANNLDIIFGDVSSSKFKMDVYKTAPVYNNKIAIITKDNQDLSINNISSLKDETVAVVKNSKIHKNLSKNNIKTKEYDTVKQMISSLSGNDIAAVDEYTYDYYVRTKSKDVKKLNVIDLEDDYGFILRDINSNKIFNEFFNYYLSFVDTKDAINDSYQSIISKNRNFQILQVVLSSTVIILVSAGLFLTYRVIKNRKKYELKLSKTDKLRYIDSMTSLKNRKYLNDNVSKWDASKVYPQSVIIVDLNNIAYINDNFGHVEGDKVIVEAAGILINNQLSDSEIIRTNGNEFLIFTIGHDEKAIVTYIRKLNKEFKELSHGFGSAIGYSMISDEIKTIDDAVNEATIDMKANKEELNN